MPSENIAIRCLLSALEGVEAAASVQPRAQTHAWALPCHDHYILLALPDQITADCHGAGL